MRHWQVHAAAEIAASPKEEKYVDLLSLFL